jgi:starch synthase
MILRNHLRALDSMAVRAANKPRALFINSGILGHSSVFNLLKQSTDLDPEIEAVHINLSDGLSVRDRVFRRLLCFQVPGGAKFSGSNIDLARWRHEMHAGLLAARRIKACERSGGRFDVLHFHTQATAYFSLKRMRSVPSVVSIDCTQGLARQEASSRIARSTYLPNSIHDGFVFRAATAIISISRWAADAVAREYPDCADKIQVLAYPVRLENFDARWVEDRFSRFAEESPSPVRVLFMGGDFIRKGGADLLAAWKAGDFAKRARLELVTDWPLAQSKLPEGVSVTRGINAFTPAWRELWRRADLFVMPTRGEAFGMVYQEAAAAGLPSIGTRINAVPEIIEDGVTGLLIAPGNVAELVKSLDSLINSAKLRREMGAAARRRIEARGCPESYAKKLTSLLKQVAGKRINDLSRDGS